MISLKRLRDRIFRRQKAPRPKYVYPTKGGWMITKSINGKQEYFGTYSTIEEACAVRNQLIEDGWGRKTGEEDEKYSYIYPVKHSGKYRVGRRFNGKFKHYGVYDTREQAVDARERIREAEWLLDPDDYINYTNGTFVVSREFDDAMREYYGTYDDLQDARNRVVELEKGGWEK